VMTGQVSPSGRWVETLFWNLQSYTWDDYLQIAECREEIEATVQWLVDSLGSSDKLVLDVGCGTGNYALALGERGCHAVGTDFAGGMLRRARVKAEHLPPGQVTFQPGDFNRGLAFPEASFDAVTAVAVLQCAEDPAQLLGEIRRVLRPGGAFLLVALDSSRKREMKKALRSSPVRLLLRGIKAVGNRSRRVRRYSRQDLLVLLGDAGFVVCDERTSEGKMALLCRTD